MSSKVTFVLQPDDRITCPKCEHEFSISDGFARQALEGIEAASSRALEQLREQERLAAEKRAQAQAKAAAEATHPAESGRPPSFAQMVRAFSREARAGRMLPFALDYQGRFVGQITVSGLHWGSLRSGHVGYWVDRRVAGRGLVPTGVAMAVDYCFFGLGLHRIEVNIRPENVASRRVVEKLGFRPEGLRTRYLHIDGAWRDHLSFALTVEDVPNGVLPGWRQRRADDEAIALRRTRRASEEGQVGS